MVWAGLAQLVEQRFCNPAILHGKNGCFARISFEIRLLNREKRPKHARIAKPKGIRMNGVTILMCETATKIDENCTDVHGFMTPVHFDLTI